MNIVGIKPLIAANRGLRHPRLAGCQDRHPSRPFLHGQHNADTLSRCCLFGA
jgi:hypothetical protein